MSRDALRRHALLVAGCLALAFFALWVVATDEVVARDNPYDQRLYVEMAAHIAAGEWLGPYDVRSIVREPSYPLWLAGVARSGVPLRLAIGLALLLAAGSSVAVLRRRGLSQGGCLVVFGLVVLHPLGLAVGREALPASLYVPVLLMAAAGLWLAAGGGRLRLLHGLWAGLALGLLWTLRPEKQVVALVLAGWAALEIPLRRWRGADWRSALAHLGTSAVAVLLAMALLPALYSAWNRRHYDVSFVSDLSAPGFVAASRELHRLPHAEPRARVLVPRDTRRAAYDVSPAFRTLAPYLERPGWEASSSCAILRICDDLGGPFFQWALREAAAAAGHAESPASLDAFFQRVADELARARRDGGLPERRASLHLVHPYPGTFVQRLPAAAARLAWRASSAGGAADWDPPRDRPGLDRAVGGAFDRIANRRAALTANGTVSLEGRVAAASDPVRGLVLRPLPGPAAARVAPAELRSERDGARVEFRFQARKPRARFLAGRPQLEVEHESGASERVPVAAAGRSVVRGDIELFVERLEETSPDTVARSLTRRALWFAHAALSRGLGLLAFFAVIVLVWPPWRGRKVDPLLPAAGLLLVAAGARFAMLTLLDASTWPVDSWRYLYPAVLPAELGAVLLVSSAWRRLRR